jgi:hypothetical protein
MLCRQDRNSVSTKIPKRTARIPLPKSLTVIQGLDLVLWMGVWGEELSYFPGYLWFFI